MGGTSVARTGTGEWSPSLSAAFAGMAAREVAALDLVYGARLSVPEVADRLQLPETAARRLLAEAMSHLGRLLCA